MSAGSVRTGLVGGKAVISEPLPWLGSIALGAFFNQGSRDDTQPGISHLIEHMIFKGTERLTARKIAEAVEAIGGVMDGFTARELSGIYLRFAKEHLGFGLELLAQLLNSPAFKEEELKREKGVVAEEIKSAEESPDERAAALFYETVYAPHPLSFPPQGRVDEIARITTGELKSFYEGRYSLRRGALVAVGGIEPEGVEESVAGLFKGSDKDDGPDRTPPMPNPAGVKVGERSDLSQVHLIVGRPAIPYNDERRYGLGLLTSILGGGMSSRLFQRLREDEGLVYSLYSFLDLISDTGVWGIYLVTDRRKLDRTLKLLFEELNRFLKEGVTDEELSRARNLQKGSLLLGLESPSARMLRWAQQYISLGRLIGIEDSLAGYDRVKREEALELLKFFEGPYWLVGVGPIKESDIKGFSA